MTNGQPSLKREKKIAETLWAASNVSLTKSNFYQIRQRSGISTPERERRRHPEGPLLRGANLEMKLHACASYRHAEALCRFCSLQNLLGECWEHTPRFISYNDHQSYTLLSIGRKKRFHPVLPEATPGAELWFWATLSFVHLSSVLFSLLSSFVGSFLPSQYPLKALLCSKSILVTFISPFIFRITVRIWGFSLRTNPVSHQKSSQDLRCFFGVGMTVTRTRTVFCWEKGIRCQTLMCYFKSFSNFKVQTLSILQKKKTELQRSCVIFPKPQAPQFHSRGLIQSDWMSQCKAFPLQGTQTQLEDSNPRGEPS